VAFIRGGGQVNLLSSSDLRSALLLAGEAREFPAGSRERMVHAMRGLARMVHAQVAIYGEVIGGATLRPTIDFGWASERERAVFEEYARGPDKELEDPTLGRLAHFTGAPVASVRRQELIGKRDWYRSRHTQELRRRAGVDAFIYSSFSSAGRLRAIALHRAWGDVPFSARELSLVDAFHGGCVFLHGDPMGDLPPRQRSVLTLLARGLSEKEIAYELKLSGHTVHDYVKALHKRLRVRSRGELVAAAHGMLRGA
jgi:DNA-binding CsgD family transcriptional regulator